MRRERALLINSGASLIYRIVAIIYGLLIPRLILATFGSAANGTISSVSQFINITFLVEGGFLNAARVEFYGPVSNKDWSSVSTVYKSFSPVFRDFSAIF